MKKCNNNKKIDFPVNCYKRFPSILRDLEHEATVDLINIINNVLNKRSGSVLFGKVIYSHYAANPSPLQDRQESF